MGCIEVFKYFGDTEFSLLFYNVQNSNIYCTIHKSSGKICMGLCFLKLRMASAVNTQGQVIQSGIHAIAMPMG